jgi:hypothetical protein
VAAGVPWARGTAAEGGTGGIPAERGTEAERSTSAEEGTPAGGGTAAAEGGTPAETLGRRCSRRGHGVRAWVSRRRRVRLLQTRHPLGGSAAGPGKGQISKRTSEREVERVCPRAGWSGRVVRVLYLGFGMLLWTRAFLRGLAAFAALLDRVCLGFVEHKAVRLVALARSAVIERGGGLCCSSLLSRFEPRSFLFKLGPSPFGQLY